MFTIQSKNESQTAITRPQYRKSDYKEISDILDVLDVTEALGPIDTDITEMCEDFNGWYHTLCDRCIPRQTIRLSRKYQPWY